MRLLCLNKAPLTCALLPCSLCTQKVTAVASCPVLSFQVAWCPTRTGLLATLTRDSNIIRLYDMQHTPTPIGDETEPTIIERSVQPCESQIGSFAWHPSTQNRMVVVSAANRVMTDFTVFERISLAWSSTTSLMWACGRHLYDCLEDGGADGGVESAIEKDIATKMRQRAESRYGHDTVQVWRNHLLAGGNDPQLKCLWFDLFYILFPNRVEAASLRLIVMLI